MTTIPTEVRRFVALPTPPRGVPHPLTTPATAANTTERRLNRADRATLISSPPTPAWLRNRAGTGLAHPVVPHDRTCRWPSGGSPGGPDCLDTLHHGSPSHSTRRIARAQLMPNSTRSNNASVFPGVLSAWLGALRVIGTKSLAIRVPMSPLPAYRAHHSPARARLC